MEDAAVMDAKTVWWSGGPRGRMGPVGRWLAVPAIVGAVAFGAVANGAFAQGGAAAIGPQTAGIFAGTCDAVGASVLALGGAAAGDDDGGRPSSDRVGAAGAIEVLVSETEADGTRLDDLLAQPHAIVVSGADGAAVACGEIGGYLDVDDELYLGLRAQNGSRVTGVALIESEDEVNVTILLVGDATVGGAATPAS